VKSCRGADGVRAVERGLLDDAEPAQHPRVLHVLLQELRTAEDRGQEVVEVVRDARRHLAQRAQTLGADEVLLRPEQLLVDADAFVVVHRAAQRERDELRRVAQEALLRCRERRAGLRDGEDAQDVLPRQRRNAEPLAAFPRLVDRLRFTKDRRRQAGDVRSVGPDLEDQLEVRLAAGAPVELDGIGGETAAQRLVQRPEDGAALELARDVPGEVVKR